MFIFLSRLFQTVSVTSLFLLPSTDLLSLIVESFVGIGS